MPDEIRSYRVQLGGGPGGIPPWLGCLPVLAVLMLMCLIPFALFDIGKGALQKIGLSPAMAGLAVFGIVVGSVINIPVKELRRDELQPESQYPGPLGIPFQKSWKRVQSRTLIAVNVGGCVIPVLIALRQALHLFNSDPAAMTAGVLVSLLSIAVCWRVARPIEGIGIMLPGFIPPLVSVLGAWLLLWNGTPQDRAAVAFIAGVAGPVIGADLLHLKDLLRVPVGVMSIGGAGTFDGIVLSGMLAALLA